MIANPALYSSACMDWETDDELIALAHRFAPIALDPATAPDNPTRARQWVAPPRDGLGEDWAGLMGAGEGHLWLNPPYGRSLPLWIDRVVVAAARIEHCTVLVPARTDTAWYRRIIGRGGPYGPGANAVVYLDGRRMFKIRCEPDTLESPSIAQYASKWIKRDGRTIYLCGECADLREYSKHGPKPIARAAFPSLLSYWGHDVERWRQVFGTLGDFRLLRAGEKRADPRQTRLFRLT